MARSIYLFLLSLAYRMGFISIYKIPVVINNFNRLTYPLQLLEFLEHCGFTNIIVLDNNSTYPPLLEFYETTRYKVIREKKNHGHLALWRSGLYHRYKWNYFVYTDPDVVPINECPENFIEYFKSILDEYYSRDKVGFGIRIDDLPDSFTHKEEIVRFEKRYWGKEVKPGIYDAPIDTTFALYKPFSNLKAEETYTLPAFRFGFPYLIKHLPWYIDSKNLSAEENYYLQTCNTSSSIGKLDGDNAVYGKTPDTL